MNSQENYDNLLQKGKIKSKTSTFLKLALVTVVVEAALLVASLFTSAAANNIAADAGYTDFNEAYKNAQITEIENSSLNESEKEAKKSAIKNYDMNDYMKNTPSTTYQKYQAHKKASITAAANAALLGTCGIAYGCGKMIKISKCENKDDILNELI
ncbi:MAG: hypothetical protein J6A28_00375 [Clostridia bacterium]|nr:hypothetical protein [Clostridia bacterium]